MTDIRRGDERRCGERKRKEKRGEGRKCKERKGIKRKKRSSARK